MIADYAVRTGGDGKQLEAAGPMSADQIVALFRATKQQVAHHKAA